MFDIGFWELMVIGIMGLIILGPERLPTAIRTIREWVNNVKQFSSTVQTELKEELRIHELHSNLQKAEKQGLKNLSPEIEESYNSLKEAAAQATRPYETPKPTVDLSKDNAAPAQNTKSDLKE